MQISNLFFLVAPAAISVIIIVLMLVPLIGYLQLKFSRQLIRQQCRFEEALITKEFEISEHNFQHVSLELHDRVGHILSLAKMHLNNDLPGRLNEASGLVSAALEALRTISRGLNTDLVSCLGLVKSLEQELGQINLSRSMNTKLLSDGEIYFLEDQTEIFIYRIAQECLSNIIRHARANFVEISLNYQPAFFCMKITDDGDGFDLNKVNKVPGCGLSNIRKRCRMINAGLEIRSIAKQGTSIVIKLPIHDKSNTRAGN
ncbi:MAG: ATP-binding protein [Chitinophagaceae bacterium]